MLMRNICVGDESKGLAENGHELLGLGLGREVTYIKLFMVLLSRHSSRSATRSIFDEDAGLSESHFAHIHQNMVSQGMPSGSRTYTSALCALLSLLTLNSLSDVLV
ncbi:hypothetical protein Tco_1212703 [Tanacetum coccineum]